MNDDLTDLLDRSAPSVSCGDAIDAETRRLVKAVVAPGAASPRRRTALIVGGAAVTIALGTGVAAAGTLGGGLWGSGEDVKVLTDPDGVTCQLVFTVSDGAPSGATEADRREARRVAADVLSDFEYVPAAVAEEIARDPEAYTSAEPGTTTAHDELGAQLHLADQAVQRALASRDLPPVTVAAESVCGEALDR